MTAEPGPWGLHWLIEEIAATLEAAAAALDAYLKAPADHQQLQFCQAHLHQVAGSLQLAENRGGGLLIEAMEAVVDALLNDDIPSPDQAGEALAVAAAILPEYLDRSLADGGERPGRLLAPLNDLRALCRQPLATEGGLFTPDLAPHEAAPQTWPAARDRAELGALCRRLRQVYQHALLGLLKDERSGRPQELMAKVAQRMQELFGDSRRGQLWQLCEAVVGQLGTRSRVGAALRLLLWELDRDLRACGQPDPADPRQPEVSRALFRNLLYYAAAGDGAAARALRERFALDPGLFAGGDNGGPRGGGHEHRTRAHLGRELLEELRALRSLGEERRQAGETLAAAAAQLRQPLRRLRDTLAVVELQPAIDLAERAAQALLDPAGAPTADGWAPWAEAIEALEQRIDHWARTGAEADDGDAARAALVDAATAAVITTVRSLIDELKDAVIGHVSGHREPSRLGAAVELARQIQQALEFIGEERLGAAIAGCGEHLAELPAAGGSPSWIRLDTLADCLIAAEYYLELLAQKDAAGAARALAQAEHRAARLRAPPGPAAPEAAAAAPAVTAAPPPAAAAPVQFQAAEEIDAEIRAIFVEEAREVLDALAALGSGDPAAPPAAIGEIRRGFHTLKGSGRMVGATDIAALCQAVEQLLNRMLDGHLEWSAAAATLLAEACALLPGLVDAFASGAAGPAAGPAAAAQQLSERAQSLAAGPAPDSAPALAPPAATVAEAAGAPDREPEPLAAAFRAEALAQLDTLAHFVAAQRGPAPAPHPELAVRAAHTLVGCGERLGHPELARALRLLEALAAGCAQTGARPAADALEAASQVLEGARALLSGQPGPDADLGALADRLGRERDRLARSAPRERLQSLLTEGLTTLLEGSDWRSAAAAPRLPALLAELRALADAAAAAGLAAPAELAGLLAARIAPPGAGLAAAADREAFADGVAQLLAMLDAIAAGLPVPPLAPELGARLLARAADQLPVAPPPAAIPAPALPDRPEESPAPAQDSGADAELVAIFLEEAAELSEQIEQAVTRWRAGDDPGRRAEELKRALHTLKGGARMAGCLTLGSLCHDFESLVMQADPAADAGFFTTCLAFCDRIEQQREQIARLRGPQAQPSAEPAPPPAPTRLPAPLAGVPPEGEIPVPAEAPPAPLPAVARAPRLASAARPPPPWRRADRAPSPRELAGAPAEPREMVKVPAAILDDLVNLADETSVSRSRIEQQLQQFHFQLEEMETTVARFHDQVRRLGMETEAQILFRREQWVSADLEDQFDPLEMDRYSTLQQLSRALEESASDLLDLKDTLLAKARETETLLIQQARVNRDLQENLSLTRMVPFARVVPRLRRIVRQTASELGKPVELELHNIEGEMDRSVLERLVPSLEHLIRNAIDHGIEPPERRESTGKPAAGRISITFSREAGDVLIQLADDGCGLDLDAIRAKALAQGLIHPEVPIAEQDLIQLIFHPGFSTSSAVSQISGRGIGLDVVDSELRQLGGSVTPRSRAGQGTEFTLRLPFTMSVNRALLMKSGRERFGTLVNSVAGVVRLDAAELERLRQSTAPDFAYRGERYRVCRLADLVGGAEPEAEWIPGKSALVLTKGTSEPVAVLVDALEPSQEIVVKSLGPLFAKVRGLSGATVLGDGQVVPILDLNALIVDRSAPWSAARPLAAPAPPRPREADGTFTVLIVDDSVTMRKATGRLLERHGYRVVTARDGVEAMQMLQEITPDLMLLDVEMPRMDGFEVARQVRGSERLQRLPIIMITSRSGEKHRNRALELGVDHYLGKPYQEEQLLALIESRLPPEEEAARGDRGLGV
ncbi:MAG: response regulator [Pseudomonadota bacterium]